MLSRTREQLVRARTRIMKQIRMKLHQFGLVDPENHERLSRRFVQHTVQEELDGELRISVESLLAVWNELDRQLNRMRRELRVQANEDPCEEVYRSVPGVGPSSARILANELGDLSRFSNEKRLFSFTGLTPGEFSSGEVLRRGHISKQGAGRLRHVLIESAWVAIRNDPALSADFERIAVRAGKKRAIVAIARKLVGRARALFRTGEMYQLGRQHAA